MVWMKLPARDVPIWVARLYLNLTLEEAGTLPRALLAMILSEQGGQGCTVPKEEEKLTCTSTKALANPVISSVNEDHASACPPLVPSSPLCWVATNPPHFRGSVWR